LESFTELVYPIGIIERHTGHSAGYCNVVDGPDAAHHGDSERPIGCCHGDSRHDRHHHNVSGESHAGRARDRRHASSERACLPADHSKELNIANVRQATKSVLPDAGL